ncbi:MAG: transglutaminase domain-containing protein [Candidatus Glassbacteria bacterium]
MRRGLDSFFIHFLICGFLVAVSTPLISFPGDVVESISIPSKNPTGLATDGEYLWYADREVDKMFALDLSTGRVVDSLTSPGYWPSGLTYDGKHLWISDRGTGKIFRIDLSIHQVDRVIEAPGKSPVGLAWDGMNLWVSDDKTDRIYEISPIDGTTIRSFEAPSGSPKGLCWDGKYLWSSDRRRDEIYMIDPNTGWVLMIIDAPAEYSWGLCWSNGRLFNIDMAADTIFELVPYDQQTVKTENPRTASVRVIHQARVQGPDPLAVLDVYIAVPSNRANQTVKDPVIYSPAPYEVKRDKWGQTVAHFKYENVSAPSLVNTRMTVEAQISELRFFIHPDSVGKTDHLTRDLRQYLDDGEKYRISDPIIVKAVKEAAGDEENPYWIARRIYEYVMDHMHYELSGGWNVAPAVLSRGNGSCSEYSFVLISMLRAAGIPARYVGSVVVRGDDVSFDEVFHRWVEFYLPGYGWIPADASRGDKETSRDRAASFGWVKNSLLITTESGGGSEYIGWTYNVREDVRFTGRCEVSFETIAEWESQVEEK